MNDAEVKRPAHRPKGTSKEAVRRELLPEEQEEASLLHAFRDSEGPEAMVMVVEVETTAPSAAVVQVRVKALLWKSGPTVTLPLPVEKSV